MQIYLQEHGDFKPNAKTKSSEIWVIMLGYPSIKQSKIK